MTLELELADAKRMLGDLNCKGLDLYLAEMIPAVEMAWADGVIAPAERMMLEGYCEALTRHLNHEAGAAFFTLGRALKLLDRLTLRRMTPAERQSALVALKTWSGVGTTGAEARKRMFDWAQAVAGAEGRPPDGRELFWLQAMKRNFETT